MNDIPKAAPSGNSKFLWIFLGIVLLALLAVFGYQYLKGGEGRGLPLWNQSNQDQGPVARVDGVEISREDYTRNLEQVTAMYVAQGMDTSDNVTSGMIREQVLNTLINRQLILAAAKQQNLTVTEADIESEYQNVLTNLGGIEALQTAMADAGLNEEALRNDLKDGLLIQQYLDTQINIASVSVSDQEVRDYYDSAAENGTDVPNFEDVQELIKEQLLAERQQQLVNTELERLRGAADIEILI